MAVTAIKQRGNQPDIEYLNGQIAKCQVVEKRFERSARAFLAANGVFDVKEIDRELIDAYGTYLKSQGSKSKQLISIYQNTLKKWRTFHKRLEFEDLLEEVRPCKGIVPTYQNRAVTFLMEEGIHSLKEVDGAIRDKYQKDLKQHFNQPEVRDYLKALDRLKLCSIQMQKEGPHSLNIQMVYENKTLFLGYHPDYDIAMLFYRVQKKEYLIWDFSLNISLNLKHQIFDLLGYILKTVEDPVEMKKAYLQPLWQFYAYCAEKKIEDVTVLETEEIEDYLSWIKKQGKQDVRYEQIIDRVQKFLFLYEKEVPWRANVWYLERFHFPITKYNPSIPIHTITYLDVKNQRGRSLLKEYVKYQIGGTRYVIHNIRAQSYNIKHFLRFLDEKKIRIEALAEKSFQRYINCLELENEKAETFNGKVLDVYHFLEFLKIRKVLTYIPFVLAHSLKKFIPGHNDRAVPEEAMRKIMDKLHLFPEDIRLMYLHLFCLGLRINEVCTIKRRGYYMRNGVAWLNVYQYKMSSGKVIPIPTMLYKAMQVYLKKQDIGLDEFVFKGSRGGAMSTSAFWHRMYDICTEFSITCRDYVFKSHDYRHSVATLLYDRGVPIQTIREFLGHRDEEMTKQYIDYMPKKVMLAGRQYFKEKGSLAAALKKGANDEGKGLHDRTALLSGPIGKDSGTETDGETCV